MHSHPVSPSPEIELPHSIEYKLSKLCARHGQRVDRGARHELARAGEQVSRLALEKIEGISNPIYSLSAYIVSLLKREKDATAVSTNSPRCSPTKLDLERQSSLSTSNTPGCQARITAFCEGRKNHYEINHLSPNESGLGVNKYLNEPSTYDEDFFKDLAAEEERLQSPVKHVERVAIHAPNQQPARERVNTTNTQNAVQDNTSTVESPNMSSDSPKRKSASWNIETRSGKTFSRFGRSKWLDDECGLGEGIVRRLDMGMHDQCSPVETCWHRHNSSVEYYSTSIAVQKEEHLSVDELFLSTIPPAQLCKKFKNVREAKRISFQSLMALGELNQVSALLVLSCFPEGGWEDAFSPEDIVRCKDLSLEELDGRLQQAYAMHANLTSNRIIKRDWSKMQDHHIVFHCEVDHSGWCRFKGPFFECTSSPLQRVFGDGGVLRVYFADLEGNLEAEGHYRRIAREGIWVGYRLYEFYAFKDPKVKKKQGLTKDVTSTPICYFICTKSLAKFDCSNPKFRSFANIHEARQYMMHIHTVPSASKKFARLQLALSQTWPVLNLDDPKIRVEMIEDIFCRDVDGSIVSDTNGEPLIHTDGTGYVSPDIAALCPAHVYKGRKHDESNGHQDYPLLMQVRIFYRGSVSKGTLLVNLKLPLLTIQIRPSMMKVKSDKSIITSSFNSLELCATSRKPGIAKLFQHLALLLVNGGVPEAVLFRFAEDALDDIRTTFRDRAAAIGAVSRSSDQGSLRKMALRMLLCGMPLNDAYLQKTMWDICKTQLQDLSKCRIAIPNSFNLMGCADPTGRLERNQVAIVLDYGPIFSTKVLLYKPPGLHPGDIHVFEATWYKEFEDIIGTGKYAVFFSVNGPRSVVDEIANSDLDGDLYWVCMNPLLIKHFKPSAVWERPNKKKVPLQSKSLSLEELEKQQFENFLNARFRPSSAMGVAANSWLAHMDRYLTLEGSSKEEQDQIWGILYSLVDTYYDAVDAEKSGEQVFVRKDIKARLWPHYMEKQQDGRWIVEEKTYRSTSIVGQIYDLVKQESQSDDFSWEPEGDIVIDKTFEYPGYVQYFNLWTRYYLEYRSEIKTSLEHAYIEDKTAVVEAVLQRYRREFYKGDTLADSPEPIIELFKKASAIYISVYTNAQSRFDSLKSDISAKQKPTFGLQFAWKVAGIVLCRMYSENCEREKQEDPIIVSESILNDIKLIKRKQLVVL